MDIDGKRALLHVNVDVRRIVLLSCMHSLLYGLNAFSHVSGDL